MSEWKPITELPDEFKDGRKLLLYPTNGSYHPNCEPQATIGYWQNHTNPKYKEKWVAWNKCSNPTHWAPLTQPPKETK